MTKSQKAALKEIERRLDAGEVTLEQVVKGYIKIVDEALALNIRDEKMAPKNP